MQPFNRETIVERRRPIVRWSAVFAGALTGIGVWMLLELIGTGAAMSALDPDELDHVTAVGLGTTAWSLLALLIAMFAGGTVAARLAGHYDRRLAGLHGALVWAVTSVFGLIMISRSIAALAPGHSQPDTFAAPEPGTRIKLERALEPINARRDGQGQPKVNSDDFIEAAFVAANPDGSYDRDVFAAKLDAESDAFDRAQAAALLQQLGDRATILIDDAARIGEHRHRVLEVAEAAGSALFGAGITMLFGLAAAIGGALLALRSMLRSHPIEPEPPRHDTAPYPVTTPTD